MGSVCASSGRLCAWVVVWYLCAVCGAGGGGSLRPVVVYVQLVLFGVCCYVCYRSVRWVLSRVSWSRLSVVWSRLGSGAVVRRSAILAFLHCAHWRLSGWF